MIPLFEETKVTNPDSFFLIKYYVVTPSNSYTYYRVIRNTETPYSKLVTCYGLDSFEFPTFSFLDCQTSSPSQYFSIPLNEFMLVSNELFFGLFNEWLWTYYLNDDPVEGVETTIIDENVNIIQLKNKYVKLHKTNYEIIDDNVTELVDQDVDNTVPENITKEDNEEVVVEKKEN
jgi:hypothetical protein